MGVIPPLVLSTCCCWPCLALVCLWKGEKPTEERERYFLTRAAISLLQCSQSQHLWQSWHFDSSPNPISSSLHFHSIQYFTTITQLVIHTFWYWQGKYCLLFTCCYGLNMYPFKGKHFGNVIPHAVVLGQQLSVRCLHPDGWTLSKVEQCKLWKGLQIQLNLLLTLTQAHALWLI